MYCVRSVTASPPPAPLLQKVRKEADAFCETSHYRPRRPEIRPPFFVQAHCHRAHIPFNPFPLNRFRRKDRCFSQSDHGHHSQRTFSKVIFGDHFTVNRNQRPEVCRFFEVDCQKRRTFLHRTWRLEKVRSVNRRTRKQRISAKIAVCFRNCFISNA